MVFADSGTRSGFYRRPAALRASASLRALRFRLSEISCKGRRTFSEPSEKAALGLGSLTHSRRFAQCAPTHRETAQNGVTS